MAVGDVSTVRVVGRYQQQNIVNSLHYVHTAQTSSEQAILTALLTAWNGNITPTWVGRHIDTYELIGLKAFTNAGATKIPRYQNVGSAGTVVGTEVPSPVCRVLTLYTASPNTRRRGRVQLSGSEVAMFDATDGSLTSAQITSLNALATLLAATLTLGGDSWELCLPASAAGAYEQVTECIPRETPSCVTTRRVRQFHIG